MEELQNWAALAGIIGALTIITGGGFALLQLKEFRRNRRYQAAADLFHQFSAPEAARAFKLVRHLPDNVTVAQLKEMDSEFEDSMLVVGMILESIGLMVYRRIASFEVVNDLAGGMIAMVWRKIGCWIIEWRELDNDPAFAEWFQWLAERTAEFNSDYRPAYVAHADWSKSRSD